MESALNIGYLVLWSIIMANTFLLVVHQMATDCNTTKSDFVGIWVFEGHILWFLVQCICWGLRGDSIPAVHCSVVIGVS